jgi:hypothetical protein
MRLGRSYFPEWIVGLQSFGISLCASRQPLMEEAPADPFRFAFLLFGV